MHNNYFEINYRDRLLGSVAKLKYFGRTITYQNVFSKTVRANLLRRITVSFSFHIMPRNIKMHAVA
jgi:hypothetical protein